MTAADTTRPPSPNASGQAARAAFLVDACAYFSAFAQALEQAEKAVYILGWDIDSRLKLDRLNSDVQLYELLNRCVEKHPDLHIHVLIWDFPLAYSADREPLQTLNFPMKTHENIHFHLDNELPVGSSHHQKVVVIDDKVAFTGGIDLTSARWDRPDHFPEEEHRRTPGGDEYLPYHDVQMVVDGEPAAILGDLARERWLWGVGEELNPPGETGSDPWPASVKPDLRDEAIAVAQTLPPYKGREERCEIKDFYLERIAKARKSIYLENQYFTSTTVRDALLERLGEEDGPEVLIVLPRMTTGLLEQLVMEPLQSNVLDDLAEADTHGRLAVYCPFADRDSDIAIKVHTKLLVVDDEHMTVGSANLNERSMGLDSECNLLLAPKNDDTVLRDFRRRLIAHHLGMPPNELAEAEEAKGLLGAVRELSESTGRLVPENKTRNPDALPVDPEMARSLDSARPGLYDTTLDEYADRETSRMSFWRLAGFGAVLAAFVTLAVVWRFTPLSEHVNPDSLLQWAEQLHTMPLAPVMAVLCFVVGGLVLFPVTLLIVLTASVFPPVTAFLISITGCATSAVSVYLLGQVLGHRAVERLAGNKVQALSRRLGNHGLVSIMITRIVPVAPYSVVNLIAGASHIRLWTFLLGTVLGMGPGIIAMTVFGGQLMNALRNPGPGTVAILVGIVAAILVLGWLLRRRLSRMQDKRQDASAEPEG